MSLFIVMLCGLIAVPVAIVFVETLAAVVVPLRGLKSSTVTVARPRVALIIPAHNEDHGIVLTLNDIKPQLLPGERLLVVADNCNDDTATTAAREGAEVIDRHDPARIGKGYALDFGLKHLASDPPAIVIIVDADCRVSANAIEQLAVACANASRPVQALDLMTAPEGSPINYRVAEFAWRVKNQVRPLGLHALNLPCQLMGTGMAFPWELIHSTNLASGALVEDVKLGLELARAGHPPLLLPSARVTSYFPLSAEGAKSQRRRWEEGNIRVILQDTPRLAWHALAGRNLALLALVLDQLVPPLSLLFWLVIAMVIVTGVATLFDASVLALAISGASLAALLAAALLAWLKYGRDVLPTTSLFLVAGYVLGKLPLYGQIFSTRAASSWARTDRGKP